MAITHRYTIMCDQIRREDNGKLLLIGVYDDIITVSQLPLVLSGITFLVRLDSDRPGMWHARLKIEHLESGRKLFDAMAVLNFQKPGAGWTVFPTPIIQFQADGAYNFVIEIQGQESAPIIQAFTVVLVVSGGPTGQGLPMR